MAVRPQSCNVLNLVPDQTALLLVFLSWFMWIGRGYPSSYIRRNSVFYSRLDANPAPRFMPWTMEPHDQKNNLKWNPEKWKWQFSSQTVFSGWPRCSAGRHDLASVRAGHSIQTAISKLPSVEWELNARLIQKRISLVQNLIKCNMSIL